MLVLLTGLAGKNINYLLNVGPTARGEFPEASVSVLNQVAGWMEHNGEAVHGIRGSPFPHDLPWGPVTRKSGKLYVHLQTWPERGEIVIRGLHNRVRSAVLLDAPRQPLKYKQSEKAAMGLRELRVQLPPGAPNTLLPVLALEIDGEADVDPGLLQQGDDSVMLPAFAAGIHGGAAAPSISISRMGTTQGWNDTREFLFWSFKVYRPGRYAIGIITGNSNVGPWTGGHKVTVTVAGASLAATLAKDEEIQTVATRYYRHVL